MQVSLFNSLNPNGKRVPVTVNIEHVDIRSTNDGELVYLVTLTTGARSKTGTRIDPVYLNNITESNLLKEIEQGLSILGDQIDWDILQTDTAAPIIESLDPLPNSSGVSIHSNVMVKIRDPYPASFIDSSTVKLKVNNIDVTPEVQLVEKDGRIRIVWIPKRIFK